MRRWTEARPPLGNLRRGSVEQGETEDLSGKENRENNQSVSYIMHNSLDKKY